MSEKRDVFVCLTGDYPNIGDALIRRRSLAWGRVHESGVHAFVGRAPQIWCDQIGLNKGDTVFRQRDMGAWLLALVRSRRRPLLVMEPGEVDLRANQYKWELLVLLFTLIVRVKGGIVVRPPRALRDPSLAVSALHWLGVRLSQHNYWREQTSQTRMRIGNVVPDIAFSEAAYSIPTRRKDALVISLRGPRALPSDEWFKGVQRFAAKEGLEVHVSSQVRQDQERTLEISSRLSGTAHNFDDRNDIEHEEYLRSLYQRSRIVVSDRLHVLILAALGGAVPCEIVPSPSPKVARHFSAVGISNISLDSVGQTALNIEKFLDSVNLRGEEVSAATSKAFDKLNEISTSIQDDVAMNSASR